MARGTVSWFNGPSGFGRIAPDEPGAELFVHRGSILDPRGALTAGDRVDFEVRDGGMGPQATEVRPSPSADVTPLERGLVGGDVEVPA